MDKLKELLSKCKCSVELEVNRHKDFYETVEQNIEEEERKEIEKEVWDKMVELNTIVSLHFYPDTPIGFYKIYHYDLDKCLEEALSIISDN